MAESDSIREKEKDHRDEIEHSFLGESREKAKVTTKNGVEVVPQPSDDPRDPLVSTWGAPISQRKQWTCEKANSKEQNWSMVKKCTIFSVMTFSTFVAISTAVANVLATPEQALSWGVTPTQAAYSVSAVLGGIVVGPILFVPLVRVVGVMSCCFWSTVLVAVTSVWSAVSTQRSAYGSFVASRFVAGIFCPTSQIFISGVIVQIFFLHQRGKAFAIYSTIYMIAQLAGPTFSGYIVQFVEWPVVFWWTVGANGLAAALIFIFGEETAWDREKDEPLARKPVPESWWSRRIALFFPGTRVAPPNAIRTIPHSLLAVFAIGFSPITVLCGIFSVFAYGWYIMAGVQVPLILQETIKEGGYSFSPLATSNFYFSAWIGAVLAVIYGLLVNDRLPLWLQKRNKGIWHVEYRLYPSWIPGLIIAPIGYGIFGAAVQYHWSWAALAVGEAMIVFSAVSSLPPTVNYIIEIFKHYPQEVGTALNVWRIAFSVAVQFIYEPWVGRVGVNWVWGTAAFLSIVGFGCIAILMWKGPWLCKFNLWSDDVDHEKPASVSDEENVQ